MHVETAAAAAAATKQLGTATAAATNFLGSARDGGVVGVAQHEREEVRCCSRDSDSAQRETDREREALSTWREGRARARRTADWADGRVWYHM